VVEKCVVITSAQELFLINDVVDASILDGCNHKI